MSCHEEVPFSRIFHHSFPLLQWLFWSQDLIPLVYGLHLNHSLLRLLHLWHLCVPPCWGTLVCDSGSAPLSGGHDIRLPSLASHHGYGQKWSSINNTICYCHCNDYFFGAELQCQLMIIDHYLNLLSWVVPCIYPMPWLSLCWRPSSSISLVGSVMFQALWSSEHCIYFVSWSDKLEYYTFCLSS